MRVRGVQKLRVVGPASIPGPVSIGMQALGSQEREAKREKRSVKRKREAKREWKRELGDYSAYLFFSSCCFGRKGNRHYKSRL